MDIYNSYASQMFMCDGRGIDNQASMWLLRVVEWTHAYITNHPTTCEMYTSIESLRVNTSLK